MTIARIAVGLGLVAATLLGGTATANASAYPRVTAWHDVNARQGCAATTCPVDPLWSMKAGDSRPGICWRHGETITAYGITNDIWVVVSLEDGMSRNVSAVFLTGDKYANLPADVECGPEV
ncbi:hypothetical protein [Kutzneria kofuensis]|uniref:Secreted protein n=1 Tax=Kutzneria kofuensis TaxID=103725 RepID=A0A7W9KES7_9PSEU|nr:hypothetical protein [Kutzneria kofuensis]MBB5891284.1 hypothetical protein [Kutzneria kofuensis]